MRKGRLKIKKVKYLFAFFLVLLFAVFVFNWFTQRRTQEQQRLLVRAPEREVRLIEGWTIGEMDEYAAKEGVFGKGEFMKAVEEARIECSENAESCGVIQPLPKNVDTLEGYLFPDTYRLYLDATPQDLVKKMLDNFQDKISNQSTQQALRDSGYTLHEVITMASIIEAEMPHAQDRPVIAGIFWKRVEAGMPLQADSTVNFVTGKSDPSVSAKDLEVNSPYNTYLYPDLPPGPIGNPGLSAITAALNPQSSPYWFYLSAKDGTTIFSITHDEHVIAKNKYLY